MKISTRIFLCYLAISTLCLYYPFDWILDTMRTRYLEGVEDPLVDQANILAEAIGQDMERGAFKPETWMNVMREATTRNLDAQIYSLRKEMVDPRIYLTDDRGKVVMHSHKPSEVGKDYSRWRDVHYTLKGEYGARTTRENEYDETSSVLYVAAPVRVDGKLAGVLTVGKPTTNITWFVENAKLQVVVVGVMALLVASGLSYLVSYWITRPIKRLTDYAIAVSTGSKPQFPRLDTSEIGMMGDAFQKMQQTIEGKRYVEQYVQNLTHEIKSPLSAIKGAAELLEEPMEEGQRQRFLANINTETQRLQKVIERMLELASLENKHGLLKVEPVLLVDIITETVERMGPLVFPRTLEVDLGDHQGLSIPGDSFLLQQALSNLIQNAADFSPPDTSITIKVSQEQEWAVIEIVDQGTGIAEFAEDRIFEKFFSLQRPESGRKSTGLGLNFVQQIAMLHKGAITLINGDEGGACARLKLPLGVIG